MNPPKILYIDDSATYRIFVKKILQQAGYEVIDAKDGLSGVEKANLAHPDLILMDMMMPGLDGYETTTLLRSTKDLAKTPIIALTSNARQGDRERCLTAGCVGYLAKPIDKKTFVQQIERYLQGQQDFVEKANEANYLKAYNEQLVKRLEGKVRELLEYNSKLEIRVNQAVQALKETQAQLLQNDKLVALGQLAAGIAHEINNPIGFIRSNLNTLAHYVEDLQRLFMAYQSLKQHLSPVPEGLQSDIQRLEQIEIEIDLPFIMSDLPQIVKESCDGTDRVKHIVQNLKDFSRIDRNNDIEYISPNQSLNSTLTMLNHALKYKVTVHKDFQDIPPIPCYIGQLDQVFMNLLMNANQSIAETGDIFISTRIEPYAGLNCAKILITDTGSGIPEAIAHRIFEPFFTTKPIGQGTGLGLSISYGIIKNHHGTILVNSTVGKGTTFTIYLPLTGVNTHNNHPESSN